MSFTVLFAQILQHMEKERKVLERLLYKIFCVMKPHPTGRTQRSLCMLLGSGMLSVLGSVPAGHSYDANGDS